MKRIYIIILAAAVLFAGCEEFQPVFTGEYDKPAPAKVWTDADFGIITPIATIKALYKDGPVDVVGNYVIKGQVVTSDKEGNVYKSFYIQDDTAGIEIKIGKNALYNEYKIGQWVYVDCTDLTVGAYEGMVQLGYKDPTGEYETAYLEHSFLIDNHVFKGEMASEEEIIKPRLIDASSLYNEEYFGTLVTIKNLSYYNRIFMIGYINPNILEENGKKNGDNRFFLNEKDTDNWGVNSWALSEMQYKELVANGNFDAAQCDDGVTVGARKDLIVPTPYTLNQFFTVPGLTGRQSFLRVRSSGYAKFADIKIPSPVRNGKETLSVTGILSKFDGSQGVEMQFTLIDLSGVTKADGSPWYNENNEEIL